MTNSIRTISVPSGSEADRIMTEWANDGKNVSEQTRKALEAWVRLDAMKRQILAMKWVLAKRGVCPSLLSPPEDKFATNHKCDLCADEISMFGTWKEFQNITAQERRELIWRQETLGSLTEMWRGY